MAEETKSTLTEQEKIDRKVKIKRILSNIAMVVTGVSIVVFVILLFMTKGNIETQTTYDTLDLRNKLKNIVNLENRYFEEHGEYAEIKFLQLCKQIPNYDPNVDGSFKYSFDPETGLAIGMEKDYNNDVNDDGDGRDGLSLSVKWEAEVIKGTSGTNFLWSEEDEAYFEQKRSQLPAE
ncbi:hypothetical protein ACFL6K_05940 [Candidatus Latescibacterota bacterium]